METEQLTIGIVGFGNFGQFLGKRYASRGHRVIATSRRDYTEAAAAIGCEYVPSNDALMDTSPNVVVFCTSIVSLHSVLTQFPLKRLEGSIVVDVLSVKLYPRELLLKLLPASADIVCTHPMFGPVSGANSWADLPFMYDVVRVSPPNFATRDAYIGLYEGEGCRMVSMTCAKHDSDAASSQFLTHMTGRILDDMDVHSTSINTAGFNSLLGIRDSTTKDSFDLFYGLYKYNPVARSELHQLEASLRHIRESLEKTENEEHEKAERMDKEMKTKESVGEVVKNQVLRSLVDSYGENNETHTQAHNDLFVNAVAMSFVRRLSRKAQANAKKDVPGMKLSTTPAFEM